MYQFIASIFDSFAFCTTATTNSVYDRHPGTTPVSWYQQKFAKEISHSLSPWHLPFNRVPTYLERQEESGNWGGQGRVWELCWWSWKNSMVADCATVAVILCQARSIMSYITYKLLTLHNWNCKQLCKVKVSTLLIVPTEWISSTLA